MSDRGGVEVQKSATFSFFCRKRGDRSASPKRVQFKENLIEVWHARTHTHTHTQACPARRHGLTRRNRHKRKYPSPTNTHAGLSQYRLWDLRNPRDLGDGL